MLKSYHWKIGIFGVIGGFVVFAAVYFSAKGIFRNEINYFLLTVKYQTTVKINPRNANAYYNWGLSLSNLGKYEEAILKYKKAIEVNPKDKEAYINWGFALYSLGQNEEAIEKFQKALDINSEYALAHTNWGWH